MDPVWIMLQAVLVCEIITGVSANVFIIYVILYGFQQEHRLSSSYKILLALCSSNVFHTFMSAVNMLIRCYWPDILSIQKYSRIIISLGSFSFISCTWLTSCLCIFYFFKIINFSSRFLTQVKLKIDTYVPCLILVAEVVSLGSGCLSMVSVYTIPISNTSIAVNSSSRETLGRTDGDIIWTNFIPMGLPLLVGFVPTFCVFRYLKLHSHRMKAGSVGYDSLKAHQIAANTMIRLLVFIVITHVVLILYCFGIFSSVNFGFWLVVIISVSFPLVQSCLLIFGNPKLKEACMERMRCRNTAKQ